MRKTRDQLLAALRQQVHFLQNSCSAFDGGDEAEATRMATTLRVLLHDTSSSISLLKQLGLKDSINFIDSATPTGPVKTGKLHNGRPVLAVSGMPGLFSMSFTPEGAKFVAPQQAGLYAKGPVRFDEWWNDGCIPGHDGARHSRRWLILQIANKEGGAHIDPEIVQAYTELQNTAMGFTVQSGGIEGFINSPGNVSVRQIVWELLESLRQAKLI